jgi:dipeptidase D
MGFDANVKVIHAGLECGIIGAKYPGMEMVSFGPNIRGAHSPDERLEISSVADFWRLLVTLLASL